MRSQLLLVQGQLLYERFKRQQHAIRNRRLLRRVINATALEEHSVAMKDQLLLQEDEIQVLRTSLEEEQRRYTHLQQETHTHTQKLQTHIQQLLQQQQEQHRDTQRLQTELGECQGRLRAVEAELQTANQKAQSAERQLTRLTLKLETSEQLQQHNFLLKQQLILLRDTTRRLTEELEAHTHPPCCKAWRRCCCVGAEPRRLQDSDLQQRQRLEAANQRAAEAELLLVQKEQRLVELKQLLEDSRSRSRAEFEACEGRRAALSAVCQTLQTEMLQLYARVQTDASSPEGGASCPPRPPSSADVLNGGVRGSASCSPPLLSLSPVESPLAVGSFLEQRAWQLFRPTNQSQPEEPQAQMEESELRPETPPLGQEAEESLLLGRSPSPELQGGATAPPADPPGVLRRRDLTIMDYDETVVTPEF